jgi:stalled ribosome rescue protein Dom34
MNLRHAVVWTDHHTAQVLQFDAEQVQAQAVQAHKHPTAQHGSGVRAEHEFFAQVCAALEGIEQVLLTGSRTAIADFRNYAEKHRPQTAARISAYEVVDHPSQNQLVALGRAHFPKHGDIIPAQESA